MRGIYSLRLRVDRKGKGKRKSTVCLYGHGDMGVFISFHQTASFGFSFILGFFFWFFWFYFRLSSLKGFYGCITFYLRRTFDVLLPFLSFISASTSYVGVLTSFLLSYLLVHPLDSLFHFSFFELAS